MKCDYGLDSRLETSVVSSLSFLVLIKRMSLIRGNEHLVLKVLSCQHSNLLSNCMHVHEAQARTRVCIHTHTLMKMEHDVNNW